MACRSSYYTPASWDWDPAIGWHNRCQHKPPCRTVWDADPVGVLSRREDNAFVMCKPCFWQIKRRHENVVKGTINFDFTNPNANKTPLPETQAPMEIDYANIDKLRSQHENEVLDRIRWCLDHNLTPADEHVHLAPGDDSNFMVSTVKAVSLANNILKQVNPVFSWYASFSISSFSFSPFSFSPFSFRPFSFMIFSNGLQTIHCMLFNTFKCALFFVF